MSVAMVVALLVELLPAQTATCTVAEDCTVTNARCVARRCTLSSRLLLFPDRADLIELELLEPADRDLVDARPALRWEAPLGADLVAVAVFDELPRVASDRTRISNFDDVRWFWYSGLSATGLATASARFEDGRAVSAPSDGSPIRATDLNDAAPDALHPGNYYWGAWAWKDGVLSHRSAIRRFAVAEDLLTGASCGGSFAGVTSCDEPVGRCLEERGFCVIACASRTDCFEHETCELDTRNVTGASFGVCVPPLLMGSGAQNGSPCASGRVLDRELKICREAPDGMAAACSYRDSRSVGNGVVLGLVVAWAALRRRRGR